jgi:hypothetical protein
MCTSGFSRPFCLFCGLFVSYHALIACCSMMGCRGCHIPVLQYPFRIPPYFALIIRAIGVLEGG